MSDSNLLPFDDAYAAVHTQLYAPAFFTKLAEDYGISPETEEEAQELLLMASKLRSATTQVGAADGTVKEASLLSAANQYLDAELAAVGADNPAPAGTAAVQADDQLIKTAATELSLHPDVVQSILSLHAGVAASAEEAAAQ